MTRTVKSVCAYCGVGCGVLIDAEDDRIVAVRGDPQHPANFGRLCTKGSTLALSASLAGRVLHPMRRRTRGAPLERAAWCDTLDELAARFADTIGRHGPDSVGFYVSGQLLTEDYYVFNKLAKALIGTNNIDTNSRLCMSSAVAAYKQTLGADAPPACYDDIDHAQCVFIAGANPAWAHPVLFRRIEDAKRRNPALKTIVVDPRRTATAECADLHLAIEPGTDVALFNGMVNLLLREQLIDRDFIAASTEGFTPLKALVRDYPPHAAAKICGITEDALARAARWFGTSRATLSLYCQGLNQSSSGTSKNAALINLHLATGQIGRPGAGPLSLTGQSNAMGGREVGGMANLLPAHRDLSDPAHREEIARFWGVGQVPHAPGKTAVELFEAVATGEVKLLWIAGTNPAQSLPDQRRVREALARAERVVVQEAYLDTETISYADVVLPAATWGEKEGTLTNSERRISRVRAAVPPPGEAHADWRIAVEFAHLLEARLRPGQPTLFPYQTAEAIWNEHRETTRSRDLDITGLSYATIELDGPQQWPYPEGAGDGRARLYEDGRFATPTGRARFVTTEYRPVAEPTDARYSFRLNTGRLRDQWHGMSRTGRVARLFGHAPEPRLAAHPADLARHGVTAGDLVCAQTRRGQCIVEIEANDTLRPGDVFLPMHWGSGFLAGRANLGVNALTLPALDPLSKQPELKHAAARIDHAALPWRLVAFGYPHGGDAAGLRRRAAALADAFDFAVCVPAGRKRTGVLFRAASTDAPAPQALAALDALFALDAGPVMRYDDTGRDVSRRLRIAGGALAAARLVGDLRAETRLRECWLAGTPVAELGNSLFLPDAGELPVHATRGRVICSCENVAENDIAAFAVRLDAAGVDDVLSRVQQTLRCGTQCGSCLPEVRRLVFASCANALSGGGLAAITVGVEEP